MGTKDYKSPQENIACYLVSGNALSFQLQFDSSFSREEQALAVYSTGQWKTQLLSFFYFHLHKTISVEIGEYSMQYTSTIYVEMGNASTEMLPAHGEEKNTRENHQAQNKNVLLYHKALRMLGYGQNIFFFLTERPHVIHC